MRCRTLRNAIRKSLVGLIGGLAVVLSAGLASAVVLDDSNKVDVTLSDGMQVVMYGEATNSGAKSNKFYYLPVNLHLAQRPDKTPEFLFLKFTTEDKGGASGGLMHFLMTWGMSDKQEDELRAKLKEKVRNAELMGAVQLTQDSANGGSFQIISATLGDKDLTKSVVTSGKAPLVPGGKAAAASRLTAEGAQLLAATFEKARSITDLSIALNYGYETMMPAAKGSITFDWSKLETEREKLSIEYSRKNAGKTTTSACFIIFCASSTKQNYAYSYDEVKEQYKFLEEKEIVKLDWQEAKSDERLAKIREAFFQYFLTSMTQKEETPPPPPAEKKDDQTPKIDKGDRTARYHFSQESFKREFSHKKRTMSLNVRLTYKSEFQLVGNLASWYQSVRDNPKCVASINLNDPFFQHRDINFILDLDGKEMFDEAVNYVTVAVRKKREQGNPFEDRVTIDAKYLKEKGVSAAVTYARGEDKNPDSYEWMSQWSLRGGMVYPQQPTWEKGTFEGVTLAPPVKPRIIEVEGDLEQMKANDITRVTVQVHYPQFGQEVEENIHISPSLNQPLTSKKLFLDRDAKGYAYRLIVNHKTEGKLALPWAPKGSDNYIYVQIPENLLKEASVKETAKEAAKTVVTSATEKVLDQFQDLIGSAQPTPGK